MGAQNARVLDNGIQNLNLSDLIKIQFKKDSYFEGQVAEGVIIFEPKQNIVFSDILIKFQQYEYFVYVIDANTNNVVSDINNFTFFEKPMNAGDFLNAQRVQGGMFSLNPGSYKIPFQFTLPENIPPSFEYPFKNRRAALRYIFSAQVLSPYAKTITEIYLWIKARPINIPDSIKHENYVTVKNVGILSRGKSGVALFTMTNNFRINDMLPFTVDIYNEECTVQVKEVKISIKRIVTFVDKGKEYQQRTAILRKKYPCLCNKNSRNSFHYDDIQIRDNEFKDVEFNRSLNPYPFLNDLNLLMPNIRSKFIKCEYSLKATSYFDLSVLGKNRPRVEMPIYITHQLQKEFEYEKNQNMNRGPSPQFSGVDLNRINNNNQWGNNSNNNWGNNNNNFGNNMNNNNNWGNNNNNWGNNNNNNNNYGNNMNNNMNNNNNNFNRQNSGSKYSYQAYLAAKNANNQNNNQNNNNDWKSKSAFQPNNNFGNDNWKNNNNNPWDNNNNNNNPWENNNNNNPWGNNNNNNYNNNNNNNPWGNNNNNNNPWENNNNNNNFNNNSNNNPWGNNNNNNNPWGNNNNNNNNNNNPWGNNNNSNNNNPWGNNSNNQNNYGGGNNGPSNPFAGGNDDFPGLNNNNNNNMPQNPFANNNEPKNPFDNNNNSPPPNPFANNNEPQNPFGGNNSGQSYPGF